MIYPDANMPYRKVILSGRARGAAGLGDGETDTVLEVYIHTNIVLVTLRGYDFDRILYATTNSFLAVEMGVSMGKLTEHELLKLPHFNIVH